MNPQDTSQLDPSIVALMHGLKTSEGADGNYDAIGDEGTAAGIGQWSNEPNGKPQKLSEGQIPANFSSQAQQYGLDPNDFSAENQNKVMYAQLSADKKSGLSPEQALSKWNSGDPNAYANAATSSGTGPVGAYNVSAYVSKAMAAAQAYAKQNSSNGLGAFAPQTSPTPTSTTVQTPTAQPLSTDSGFLGDVTSGNLGGALKDAGNFLFPAVGDVYNDVTGKNNKTALQQAGDLGTSALSAIAAASLLPESAVGAGAAGLIGGLTGADAETALGRIGGQAAFGGAMGLSGALGQGQTNLGQIAGSTALGGATGGVVGGASELLSKAAAFLPQRFAKSFIPGINDETAEYAVKKGLGSPTKMLADSDASLSSIGKTLGSALTHPQYDGVTATANDILPKVISAFPNAGLTNDSVGAALEKVAPLQKNLIQKLVTGDGLSLDDLHTLNSAIGKNTYKTVFDDPVTKAGKELANAFYQSAKDFTVSTAPETSPLFDQYGKEKLLNNGLQKAVRSGSKGIKLSLKDILALSAGFSGGPVRAGGALALERLGTNPSVNLNAAGLLSRFGQPIAQALSTPVTGLLSRFAPQLTQ